MNAKDPVSRRCFLAATAKLGAVAVAASAVESVLGVRAAAAAPTPAWQIGCYTRPFDQFDYRVALDGIAEAGFKYVGLMTTNSKQWVMIKATTPVAEVQTMKDEAGKRGLKGTVGLWRILGRRIAGSRHPRAEAAY